MVMKAPLCDIKTLTRRSAGDFPTGKMGEASPLPEPQWASQELLDGVRPRSTSAPRFDMKLDNSVTTARL